MRAALALCALAFPLAFATPAAASATERPADAISRAFHDLHRAADADGDGTASQEEIRSFLARLPRGEALVADRLLAEADADGDGAVEAGEIIALERDFETFLAARLPDDSVEDDGTDADPATTLAGI